jgi:excisionase family DNA binding protein
MLTVRQVAEILGVCRATVYRLCAEGWLPHVRVLNSIRVRAGDLVVALQPGGALAAQTGPKE